MAAQYLVTFRRPADGAVDYVYVNSADATSMKKPALAKANRKAVDKARSAFAKRTPEAADYRATDCRCVG